MDRMPQGNVDREEEPMHVDNMPFHAFSAKLRPLRFSVVEGLKNFTHAGTCTSPSVNLGSEVKFVGQIHFETAWKTRLSDIAPLRACSSDLWMQPSSPIVDERNLDVMQNEQNICQRESILLNLSQVMNGKSARKRDHHLHILLSLASNSLPLPLSHLPSFFFMFVLCP